MSNFQQFTMIGRATRDVITKNVGSSTLAEWGMATNRKYKTTSGEEREDNLFIDCNAWGKTGEIISKYVTKGMSLFVTGRLRFSTWEDKQGGKRSKIDLIVESFQFLGSNRPDGGDGQQQRSAQRQPVRHGNAAPVEQPFGNEQDFDESEIPF